MQFERITVAITGRDGKSSDERQPFDRSAPSRSRTFRCGSVTGVRQQRMMQRSLSTNQVSSLSNGVNVDWMTSPGFDQLDTAVTQPEGGNRFRKRLDIIRSNLIARLTRQQQDGEPPKDERRCDQRQAVSVNEHTKTRCNGVDTSPVNAPSSSWTPAQKPFERRQVHRRTLRRHRTVVVNELVGATTSGGMLRRYASSGARMLEMGYKDADDVIQCQQSELGGYGGYASSHNDVQQLLATRETSVDGDGGRNALSTVVFEVVLDRGFDGARKLGFTVVGGCDSPKGPMGIYIKTIFPGGLADQNELREGDEIVELNGTELAPLTHSQAVASFKRIRRGRTLLLMRRHHHLSNHLTSDSDSSNIDDAKSLRTLSACEPVTFNAVVCKLHVDDDDKTQLSTAVDGSSITSTEIADRDNICRAKALERSWKQLSPRQRSHPGDVYTYPAVTSPPCWINRLTRSATTTSMTARSRPEVIWCSQHQHHQESRVHVGLLTNVRDIQSTQNSSTNEKLCSVSDENAVIPASTGNEIMSFPDAFRVHCGDVTSRLCSRFCDKNVRRRHSLESHLSTHSAAALFVGGSLKTIQVLRQSISCFELSAVATKSADTAPTSWKTAASTSRKTSGEFAAVSCRPAESGTSSGTVSITSTSSASASSSADVKCRELRDEESHAGDSEDKQTIFSLIETEWPRTERSEPSCADSNRMLADYFDADAGCINDDVKSNSSSNRDERQLIFV